MTAVEWLCKQYHLKQDIEIVKQAKEMEKQQSYSEEEVIDLIYKRSIYQDHFESDVEVRKWFEKFKNK